MELGITQETSRRSALDTKLSSQPLYLRLSFRLALGLANSHLKRWTARGCHESLKIAAIHRPGTSMAKRILNRSISSSHAHSSVSLLQSRAKGANVRGVTYRRPDAN